MVDAMPGTCLRVCLFGLKDGLGDRTIVCAIYAGAFYFCGIARVPCSSLFARPFWRLRSHHGGCFGKGRCTSKMLNI